MTFWKRPKSDPLDRGLADFYDIALTVYRARAPVFRPAEYLDRSVIAQWSTAAYEAVLAVPQNVKDRALIDTLETVIVFDEKKRWGRVGGGFP